MRPDNADQRFEGWNAHRIFPTAFVIFGAVRDSCGIICGGGCGTLLVLAIFALLVGSVPLSSHHCETLDEIYVIPLLGHLDVGFTATQREVKLKWRKIYREGIELLERVPDAKITSDSLLPIEWFKESASDDEWARFKKLVQSGRWELTGGWAHMNTSVISEAEARRYFLQARKWEEELRTRIKIWHHADVPGLGWNMAESASDAGLELIVVGANELGGLTPFPPLPSLFNWEAPDGDKITVSLHGGSGYLQGGLDLKLHILEGLEERLRNFGGKLRKQGYPLDFAMVLFSSGDNRGPAVLESLFDTVKKWNAAGKSPRLRISTFAEFNEKLEPFRRVLPSVRADFPASWEALIMRAPRGEKAARTAKRNLQAAEALSVVNEFSSDDDFTEAWQNVLLHDEHAGIGTWDGTMTREQLYEQNLTEYRYALNALHFSQDILFRQSAALAGGSAENDTKSILFFNTTSTRKNLSLNGDSYFYSLVPSSRAVSAVATKRTRLKKFENTDLYRRRLTAAPSEANAGFSFETKSVRVPIHGMLTISSLFFTADAVSTAGEKTVILNDYPNCTVNGYMRAGVWIDSSILAYSAEPKLIFTQEGALLNCGEKHSILVRTDSGAPLFLSDGNPAFIIYKQEAPVKFSDGTMGTTEQEPTAENTIQTDIFVMEMRRTSPLEAYLKLHELTYPQTAVEANLAGGFKKKQIYLRADDPRAIITGLWRAEFGEGIVVAVRNISSNRITTVLRSDYWDITQAQRVDLLEREIDNAELFCVDNKNRRCECKGASLKPYVTLAPFSVRYVKFAVKNKY